jgi:abortive infection bacteriophage resistance protein
LITNSELKPYIGEKRFGQYFCNPTIQSPELSLETYKFDIELRGLLISALGVIEVGLEAQLNQSGFQADLQSFGHARKVLEGAGTSERELISRNLGARNYKELRGALQNLNYLRNRVAHHERVWNHRNPFSFPDFGSPPKETRIPKGQIRRLIAWSLFGIEQILCAFPELIAFERQFESLVTSSSIDHHFLLTSMGFEAP